MITATSQPNYDDWGWDDYWNCNDWITWHQELVKAHGIDYANRRFVEAFHQATFGAASYDCRTFNSAFRKYASDNGFLEALYDGLLGTVMSPVGTVIDIGGNIVDAAGNIAGAASNATETIKKVIPILIILVVIIGLILLAKKAQIL